MIKMRNVGAQTQKKWRPRGPPLEGRGGPKGGARRNGARRVGGPDLEKVRASRVGVRRVGSRRVGHRSVGARRVGGPKAGSPKFRAFFPLSRSHFRSFSLSLWGVFSWNFGGEREKERKWGAGEGKKNLEILGGPAEGGSGGGGSGGVRWRK